MTIQACADLVAKGDPARFRATMAAPLPAREVLFPIHAFCLEVARAPWVTQETMIAEMRLQWWRDVLGEIATGKPPRAHEVAAPLAATLPVWAAQDLDAAVAARQWDIYREAHADAQALSDYLHQSYALPMQVAARVLGAPTGATQALNQLGDAGALARYFLAIPALQEASRIPLVDGRLHAVHDLAEDALAKVAAAKPALSHLPRTARAPMIDAAMHLPILRRVQRDPAAVAEGRLGQGPLAASLRLGLISQAPSWMWI